jgi:hypothetical protein
MAERTVTVQACCANFRFGTLVCDRPDWNQAGRESPDQTSLDPSRADHGQTDLGLAQVLGSTTSDQAIPPGRKAL